MLPTFVIGLREGLEAALIVGIIAAFLRQQGRRDLLRWVFVGVGAAMLLCVAVGATLEAVSSNLPQRQQESLETVVGVLAVGMVTYMVVWMRPAGAITFKISNKDATAVSEVELQSGQRIVGEKENLPPGFSGTFSVNADAGKYTLSCPGAAQEYTTLTVTGSSASTGSTSVDTLLAEDTKQYASYVTTQIGYLVQTSVALQTALRGNDLTAAQQAYRKARPYYEKIGPVAESFTVGSDNLDSDIDARIDDVPASQWEGFHRIEKGLFQEKSLSGLSSYGSGLLANVEKLQTLTDGLTYKPFGLANKRPAALAPLPTLPGDGSLQAARSGGDLCVQACADDPTVAFHAIRNFAWLARVRP
ncbi:FTR1 family protein [Actinospica sp.]|uniref:FTR1 family protein n=1 Tax=Actinospica sp. TaxID=1872142 RepID=UPI002C056A1D|nr:FTR1 family protein [Actinospica sp.]HWG22943.1 FTR1 family protein [Actinospica sp.]